MIFMWSNNGGPMQYIGLAFLALQYCSSYNLQMNMTVPVQVWGIALGLLFSAIIYGYGTGARNRLYQFFLQKLQQGIQIFQEFVFQTTGTSIANNRFGLAIIAFLLMVVATTLLLVLDLNALMTIAQLAAILCTIRERQHGAQGGGGGGAAQQQREEEHKQRRIAQIVDIIHKMPIEEFIAEAQYTDKDNRNNNGIDTDTDTDTDNNLSNKSPPLPKQQHPRQRQQQISISQLKQMLQTRGQLSTKSCEQFIERNEFLQKLRECRKYCETCCICCEEYNIGDPIRVLPKCKHEFHVECVDQWAYTFADRGKRERQPSCPLCNTQLQ